VRTVRTSSRSCAQVVDRLTLCLGPSVLPQRTCFCLNCRLDGEDRSTYGVLASAGSSRKNQHDGLVREATAVCSDLLKLVLSQGSICLPSWCVQGPSLCVPLACTVCPIRTKQQKCSVVEKDGTGRQDESPFHQRTRMHMHD
jgi:hypothetical protein